MPRPRGADAAGLLLRELELHPPAEEWHRRNMYGGPWSDPEDNASLDNSRLSPSRDLLECSSSEYCDVHYGAHGLWPRKRRMSERDAAFGLNTSVGLGAYLGIMGSRRDVVTAIWKTGLEGVWYKVGLEIQNCDFFSDLVLLSFSSHNVHPRYAVHKMFATDFRFYSTRSHSWESE